MAASSMRLAHEHGLEHPLGVLRRGGHAAAEQQRHVVAHGRARNGVLIDQQHRLTLARTGERRGKPGGASANHDEVVARFGAGSLVPIAWGSVPLFGVHDSNSLKCLSEIRNQIIDMFEPDGQAHRAIGDAAAKRPSRGTA